MSCLDLDWRRLNLWLILLLLVAGCADLDAPPSAFPFQIKPRAKLSPAVVSIFPVPERQDKDFALLALHISPDSMEVYFQMTDVSLTRVSGRSNIVVASLTPFSPGCNWEWSGIYQSDLNGSSAYYTEITSSSRSIKKLDLYSFQTSNFLTFNRPDSLNPDDLWEGSVVGPLLAQGIEKSDLAYTVKIYPPRSARSLYLFDSFISKSPSARIISGAGLFITEVVDIDEDGKPELLMQSQASCNGVSAGGISDGEGWFVVTDQRGKVKWKVKSDYGNGSTVFRWEPESRRLFGVWNCLGLSERPTPYCIVYEFNPKSGEILQDTTLQGVFIWPETAAGDSNRWGMLVTHQQNSVGWMSRDFRQYGEAKQIDKLEYYQGAFVLPGESGALYQFSLNDQRAVLLDEELNLSGHYDGILDFSVASWISTPNPDGSGLLVLHRSANGKTISVLARQPFYKWYWSRIWKLVTLVSIFSLGGATLFLGYRNYQVEQKRRIDRAKTVGAYTASHPLSHRLDNLRSVVQLLAELIYQMEPNPELLRALDRVFTVILELYSFSDILKVTGRASEHTRSRSISSVFFEKPEWYAPEPFEINTAIKKIWKNIGDVAAMRRQHFTNDEVPKLRHDDSKAIIDPWIAGSPEPDPHQALQLYRPADLFYEQIIEELLLNAAKYALTEVSVEYVEWIYRKRKLPSLKISNDFNLTRLSLLGEDKAPPPIGKQFLWADFAGTGGLKCFDSFIRMSGVGPGVWALIERKANADMFTLYVPLSGFSLERING